MVMIEAFMQAVEKQIWDILEAGVVDMGLRLVRVQLSGGDKRSVLQIMIEPQEASAENPVSIGIEECEAVSRMASALLDVEDPISSAYTLEVSSTGVERPLVIERDFEEYVGRNVKVSMHFPVDGRRKFYGTILAFQGGVVSLECEGVEVSLPYAQIKKANLALSDDELKSLMKKVEG